MKTFLNIWWCKRTRNLSIISYRRAWIEAGIDPCFDYQDNGAVKGRFCDTCLDKIWTFGYIVINYTDYDYNKEQRAINLKQRRNSSGR